jgi:hypothetical protein
MATTPEWSNGESRNRHPSKHPEWPAHTVGAPQLATGLPHPGVKVVETVDEFDALTVPRLIANVGEPLTDSLATWRSASAR